jgi:HD-like signal output (HDOD) protein
MSLSPDPQTPSMASAESPDLMRSLKGIVIPPRPAIMDELLQEMRSSNPNLSVIAKLVSKDVGLTTGVLRVVNAPFFGLSRKINSVDSAINMLGLTNLSKIATGIMVKQAMSRGDLTQFWETAEGVANICGHLANDFLPSLREEAYTFGLLQNIGVALIMQKYADYDEIEYQAQINQKPILEVEDDFYDTNHATLGYILAKSWNLSKDLSQAILRHHDVTVFEELDSIPQSARDLVAIGNLATHIYNDTNESNPVDNESVMSTQVLKTLQISQSHFDRLKNTLGSVHKLS